MIKSNYIVFDVETGGLDPNKNPMTQYAAVVLDGRSLKEIDRFETYIKPYNNLVIEKQALEHTQVRMSDINKGISIKNFVEVVTEWWSQNIADTKIKEMGRLIPVGHNVPFDIGFVDYALKYVGVGTYTDWMYPNLIDTFGLGKMAFGIQGDEKLNLTACCERAKIKLADAHGAMNDVEATAELFRWFMKKLRSKAGAGSDSYTRARGAEFFEFRCGVK